jgi:ABC-2 type transport system ATP-binding protein
MGKIIELQKVFKSYGKKKVLEDVSFGIEEGKFTTLIGCNGAGKSTTLRLLAGIETCDSGKIQFYKENPYAFDFPGRKEIFFIHENYSITSPSTLLDMIKVYRYSFPRWSNKIFNQILKDRKISIKKKFFELSRGQKIQFLLMVALASQPRILFLDEITSVIDIEGQRYFLDQLQKYVENGGTVVITTNILSELNDYTHRLLLIQETKLKIDSPVEELQSKFIMLKKLEDHPVFKHKEAACVRKDYDGRELYLIPRHVLDEDTQIIKFKFDHPPKLEDILILHFHLKEELIDEEVVA